MSSAPQPTNNDSKKELNVNAKPFNINAKPFVPTFGQPPAGGSPSAQAPQQQQKPAPAYTQSPQQNGQLPPPPPPPMNFAPPYGMPPFGMMGAFPGGAPPPRFFPPPFNNGYMAPPPMFNNNNNNTNHNGPKVPAYGQPHVTVSVGGVPTPPLGPTRAPAPPGNGSFHNGSFNGAQQPPTPQAPAARKPVTFPRKVVFLVLGGRGSGKSTQCEKLAKHYNLMHIAGGQFVAEKKLPLVELDRVLGERFVKGAEHGKAKLVEGTEETNGLVLDRMVGLHEYDAYYLDQILRSYGMAVELVFLLMLDSETAGQRALARGDSKPVDHTRQMAEHRVQYAAVNTVFSPLKILHCVECDGMPLEAITRALDRVIEHHYTSGSGNSLPQIPSVPHHPYTQGLCKVYTDFVKFHSMRQEMLVAVHNQPKPGVVCPASLMCGLADRRMFCNPKQARPLVNSYVTLKADGQRVLLFKNREGIFGINGIFHFMFHFTPYFESYGITFPKAPEGFNPEHGVEWVLDAEVFSLEGRPQIAVFDHLYLFGGQGNAIPFERRLETLTDFFGKVTIKENPTGTATLHGPSPFFLKQYVQSAEIRKLLPEPGKPPFPIDGVVFQHLGGYKFGKDKAIFKWKPRDHCTIDFRLDKSVDPQLAGAEWTFVPMVGDAGDEVQWPNAQVRATDADARRCDLCDGAIVECVKRAPNPIGENNNKNSKPSDDATAPTVTIWDFVRVRPEKSTPNGIEIAKAIDSIEHLTFEELAQLLVALGGKKN